MENLIQVFNNPQFGKIRTAGTADNPLFCLSDVCKALGLTAKFVNQRLNKEVVSNHPLETTGGTQQALFVNEDGLYDVILDSRKPEARQFRKWVTSDVLPSIRKTGGYISTNDNMTESEIMARAVLVANSTIEKRNERIRQLEADNAEKARAIEEAQPSIVFTQAVSGSVSSCLVGELAKLIDQNGYPMGEKRLFRWLRDNEYLGTKGERYNIPNQRYIEKGFFELKKGTRSGNNGVMHTTVTTKVTGKGQVYFINLFAKKSGKEAATWNR